MCYQRALSLLYFDEIATRWSFLLEELSTVFCAEESISFRASGSDLLERELDFEDIEDSRSAMDLAEDKPE